MIMFGRTSRFSEKVGFLFCFLLLIFFGGVLFCLFLWIVFRQKKLGEGGCLCFIIIIFHYYFN